MIRSLGLFFISMLLLCCNQTTDSKEAVGSKEVVFVCPHGAARSPIAAAYFNKMATEQSLNYHATFRGTVPDETLSARTIEGLTKEGIDIKGWKPSLISSKDIDKAYKIVTFDCEVPAGNPSASRIQWNGTPSPSKEYEAYTQRIREEVKKMIADLPK